MISPPGREPMPVPTKSLQRPPTRPAGREPADCGARPAQVVPSPSAEGRRLHRCRALLRSPGGRPAAGCAARPGRAPAGGPPQCPAPHERSPPAEIHFRPPAPALSPRLTGPPGPLRRLLPPPHPPQGQVSHVHLLGDHEHHALRGTATKPRGTGSSAGSFSPCPALRIGVSSPT